MVERPLKTVAHLKNFYLNLTETFVYGQITGLKRYRPVVYTHLLRNEGVFPFESIYVPRVPVWRRRVNGLKQRLLGDRGPADVFTTSFVRACEGDQVELLHCHFLEDATRFVAVAERTGLPLIVSCYGYDVSLFPRQNGAAERLERTFSYGALKVLVMSEDMKIDVVRLGCLPEKIEVLPLGVTIPEIKRHQRKEAAPVRFLCAASFVEKKGIQYLLEAFSALKSQTDAFLTLVGDGPLRSDFEQIIGERGMEDVVDISMGYVNHARLAELMDDSDVFVHPSVTAANGDKEGTPMGMVEAMAHGLPVVGTFHAGIPETIKDGFNGRLVEERNSDALATVMLELALNSEKRLELGVNAGATIEANHNIVSQLDRLEQIYDRAVIGDQKLKA